MIRSGGYQTGLTYRQYRAYGHNPFSAWLMRHSDHLLLLTFVVLGAATGVLLGLAW